ncbi:MAG: transporter ATP-binding protein [Deltaproteobacteria bacterium]|nr:transporter ATP-binding protein [Deltaproteobacteria bacterium]
MNSFVLEIQNLTVNLPAGADRDHAVSEFNLQLRPSEILCVVGESGSGKSIMAKAVMGLLPEPHVHASSGKIFFEGEDLLSASPSRMRQIRGSRISMIFQEPMTALNPVMTILDQIEEVIFTHQEMPKEQRFQRMVNLLRNVHLPDPERILYSYPHQLSGGQRQRAMIAMALILEPAVLIADEPTTALDVTTQAQILSLIRDLEKERNTGVLFITHDFGVVAEIADRVAVMQHGRLVEVGDAKQVLNAPQHPYTRSLIAAVPSLTPRAPKSVKGYPVVLKVQNLNKIFRSSGGLFGGKSARAVQAAKEVNLSIRRSETLGIVGESGSGKSTVARCIVRLVEADSGSVHLGDIDFLTKSRRQLRPYRKRIQMVFQDPFGSLNPRRKVAELISEGPMVHGLPKTAALERAYKLLDLVGLDPRSADRYPHEFSGGQRQRIGIARALALEPEILIADEPVSALDVSVQAQILQLLSDIRDRLQLSLLFITHDLRVAAQVCDTIAVMLNGEVVEYGTTMEIFLNPRHSYTQQLINAVPGKSWTKPSLGTIPLN